MGSEMRGREYLKEMSNVKTECKRLMKKYETVSGGQSQLSKKRLIELKVYYKKKQTFWTNK